MVKIIDILADICTATKPIEKDLGYLVHKNVMRDRHCRDRMGVEFITTCQSVSITTNIVILNHAQCQMYSIQLYEIKFVSDRSVVFTRYTGFLHQST